MITWDAGCIDRLKIVLRHADARYEKIRELLFAVRVVIGMIDEFAAACGGKVPGTWRQATLH